MKKSQLLDRYNPQSIEQNKTTFWNQQKYFYFDPSKKAKHFKMVIPPPNVTGKLHLGHAWDVILQDFLIRYHKLRGYNVSWSAGLDHAGIATQIKVENQLWNDQGLSRFDLGRKKLVDTIWQHYDKFRKSILQQWHELGLALDYSHIYFTLDDNFTQAVNKAFSELYQRNLIYQGYRIVPWDTKLNTALSDAQVEHKEIAGQLYYFKYNLVNQDDCLIVATTRPETMFADQCVVVNPHDPRYTKYHGLQVINPANQQTIPIIVDDYVDPDFGTGVMKCTPAHDFNDFVIGQKHHLQMPLCINFDGCMNELAGEWKGLDRFACREKLVQTLTSQNLLQRIESHNMQVGYSVRTQVVVEPLLSKQWFVKSSVLAKDLLKLQKSSEKIDFFPRHFENKLHYWLEHLHDWCISRQIWWGHRIPVWTHKENKKLVVGTQPVDYDNYIQEEDVFDTWFSSALWPLVANGWPKTPIKEDSKLLNVMVSGYDILSLWISRMMQQTQILTKSYPFAKVLLHGLIRDHQGRKMSKSLNNGVDPYDVINQFGNDALRLMLLTHNTPGLDMKWIPERMDQHLIFLNKLWNAARYIELLNINYIIESQTIIQILRNPEASLLCNWIVNELHTNYAEIQDIITNKLDFSLAFQVLQNFFINKFCAWMIEFSKQSQDDDAVILTLTYCFQQILIMFNPFIPFITEEIMQSLFQTESIYTLQQNVIKPTTNTNNHINWLIEIIGKIRQFRQNHNIVKSKIIQFCLPDSQDSNVLLDFLKNYASTLKLMVNAEVILKHSPNQLCTPLSTSLSTLLIVPIVETLMEKQHKQALITKQKAKLIAEINRSHKILNNEQFLKKAHPDKIALEQNKLKQYTQQLSDLEKTIVK